MINKFKHSISLIFLVKDNDKIENILDILNQKQVSSNFFIDGYWLENNRDNLNKIQNHMIGNLSYNGNYADGGYISKDTMMEKIKGVS